MVRLLRQRASAYDLFGMPDDMLNLASATRHRTYVGSHANGMLNARVLAPLLRELQRHGSEASTALDAHSATLPASAEGAGVTTASA
jgi:hypothetical protein